MSFNIRSAMVELAKLQEGLTIEDPIKAKIAKAWPMPPTSAKMNDFPMFLNTPRLQPTVFASALMRRTYVVEMQLMVKDADFERACDIAMAFEEELLRALGTVSGITLNGTVTNIETIEGELGLINDTYPGLDYFLTLHMAEERVR